MKIIFILVWVAVSSILLSARDLHLIVNHNNSEMFIEEGNYIADFLDESDLLKHLDIEKIYILDDEDAYTKRKLPEIEDIESYNDNLSLEKLLVKIINDNRLKHDDVLLIVSSMDYVNRHAQVDSKGKVYNDGWITSAQSPIKKLIDRYLSKPLSGLRVIILDPNRNLKYINKRRRFFSFLFNKLGAKLYYYGSLDGDYLRIFDYASTNKNLDAIYQKPALKLESILKLDDSIIQYNLE